MKKIKKMLCMAMAAVMALSMSVEVSAECADGNEALQAETSTIVEIEDEDYVLVSEEKHEEGPYMLIDRIYVLSDVSTQNEGTGQKTVRKSRSIYDTKKDYGQLMAIMWVEGNFKWDSANDKATISNPRAWIDEYDMGTSTIYVKTGYPKYGSNQGATVLWGLFGYKYAYIEYIVVVENYVHSKNEFRLWLDVNVKGDVKTKT